MFFADFRSFSLIFFFCHISIQLPVQFNWGAVYLSVESLNISIARNVLFVALVVFFKHNINHGAILLCPFCV